MRLVCWDNKEYERSGGLPWNAWVHSTDGGPASFEAGGWWRALAHLRKCKKCREENQLSLEDVEEQLMQLEKEWDYVMGGDTDEWSGSATAAGERRQFRVL